MEEIDFIPNNKQDYSEEIKKFWPSELNYLDKNYNEISLITFPKSKIFDEVANQLRRWSSLGIVKPFLLVSAEEFNLKENESPRDLLRRKCEFIFPSFFKSIEDNTRLTNPLFPYLADLGNELNQIRLVSVLSPDLEKGNSDFFTGLKNLVTTIDENRPSSSIKTKISRVIIPSSKWLDDKAKTVKDCIDKNADVNVVISPEDKVSAGGFNAGVMVQDTYVSHASFFISTVSNLWIGSKNTPFDEYKKAIGKEEIILIRGYGRLIVSDNVVENVANNIKNEDGSYVSPNSRVSEPNKPDLLIDKIASEFFNEYIYNSNLQIDPQLNLESKSKVKSFIEYMVSRLKIGANSIYINSQNKTFGIFEKLISNQEDNNEFNFTEKELLNLSEEIATKNNLNILPTNINIFEKYISKLLSQVDGSELFIQESSDKKFNLLLNSEHIVGSSNSILEMINHKIKNYKNKLGASAIDWLEEFYKEFKKDTDGTIKKFISTLKFLRILEVASAILVLSNGLWFVLDYFKSSFSKYLIFGNSIEIPTYLLKESLITSLSAIMLFIFCNLIGYRLKNKIFGNSNSIFDIESNLEKILMELLTIDLIQSNLDDWQEIIKILINKPFFDHESSSEKIKQLKEVNSIAKSFQIAEGQIDPMLVNQITASFTKQGWYHNLFFTNFENFKHWRTNQNKPLPNNSDIEKAVFLDFSLNNLKSYRKSFSEYFNLGFSTLHGRTTLENEIAQIIKNTDTKKIFSNNITIVEDRGTKPEKADNFLGQLDVKDDSDYYFLPQVFTNKAINEIESTKVARTAFLGDPNSDDNNNKSLEKAFDLEYFPLDTSVKAGAPIQKMRLRIDISAPNPPENVGKIKPGSEDPFKDFVTSESPDDFL